MNKSVRGLFTSLAIGAILASSSAAVLSVPAAAQDSEDVTLSVMASQDWIKPAEQELAKQFEAETGIHVDYQIIPSDQYFNVLKTKLNSGEATDIFGGQTGKSDLKLQYDVENNAVDLTGEEWTSRIDPAALDMSSLDGKVYGAEIWDIVASNYFVMVYNKDIFEQLGISVPKDFDEFKAACTTIKDAGITPDLRADRRWMASRPLVPHGGSRLRGGRTRPRGQAQRQRGDLRRRRQHDDRDEPDQRALPGGLLRRQRPVRPVRGHEQRAGERPVRHVGLAAVDAGRDRGRLPRTSRPTRSASSPSPPSATSSSRCTRPARPSSSTRSRRTSRRRSSSWPS